MAPALQESGGTSYRFLLRPASWWQRPLSSIKRDNIQEGPGVARKPSFLICRSMKNVTQRSDWNGKCSGPREMNEGTSQQSEIERELASKYGCMVDITPKFFRRHLAQNLRPYLNKSNPSQ